jgi:hypothetical protein
MRRTVAAGRVSAAAGLPSRTGQDGSLMRLILALWHDDRGSGLLTGEWLFLFAILLLGSVGGLISIRQAVVSELQETASALTTLNRSFSFSGQSNSTGKAAGTSASDMTHTIANSSSGASVAHFNQVPAN